MGFAGLILILKWPVGAACVFEIWVTLTGVACRSGGLEYPALPVEVSPQQLRLIQRGQRGRNSFRCPPHQGIRIAAVKA
jgi:hypothetical protein